MVWWRLGYLVFHDLVCSFTLLPWFKDLHSTPQPGLEDEPLVCSFTLFLWFKDLHSARQPGLEDEPRLEDNWKDQSQLGHVVVVCPFVQNAVHIARAREGGGGIFINDTLLLFFGIIRYLNHTSTAEEMSNLQVYLRTDALPMHCRIRTSATLFPLIP